MGTPRGDPQPHALSLACASFFVILTACSTRFAPQTGRIDTPCKWPVFPRRRVTADERGGFSG